MIACVDVYYEDTRATAACVLFEAWADAYSAEEAVVSVGGVEPYEPGQFFRRELPCLIAVLAAVYGKPQVVVIDGYVWLGDENDPGLGAHLYETLGGLAAVVGVAKTKFAGVRAVKEVLRGGSRSPLYITTIGLELPEASGRIQEMHGAFRIPTLLTRVDHLSRGLVSPILSPRLIY